MPNGGKTEWKTMPASKDGAVVPAPAGQRLAMLGREIARRQAVPQLEVGRPPLVQGNPGKIKKALLNLLQNALASIPKAGHITVRTGVSGAGKALVEMQDDGPGFTEADRKKLFEPFARGVSQEPPYAPGLGLSIAYNIIHEHGGDITVASKIGHGATFTITLPPMQIAG